MELIKLAEEFQGLTYDEKFKMYRKLWGQLQDFKILTDFPLHLDIELTSVCNLRCEFCFQNGLLNGPLGNMEMELFSNIIDEGVKKGLCAIKLQVRGEAFLHPKLFKCIQYAKTNGILDIQITTNGSLIDEKVSKKIFDSGLDGIIFSCDETHQESFKRLKSSHSYSPVESTIKSFLELRSKLGKTRPWVRLVTNTTNLDTSRLQALRESIREKFPDADVIAVNRHFNPRDDVDAFPDLRLNYDMKPCPYTMQRLAVFWNGDVTTCAWDYNNRFKLGNLKDNSIEEIWFSEKIDRMRKMHLAGQREMIPVCKHCHSSLIPKTNKTAVDNLPRHYLDHNMSVNNSVY